MFITVGMQVWYTVLTCISSMLLSMALQKEEFCK